MKGAPRSTAQGRRSSSRTWMSAVCRPRPRLAILRPSSTWTTKHARPSLRPPRAFALAAPGSRRPLTASGPGG
eukprot:5328866-Alexandrium_andersonii.AAC.1